MANSSKGATRESRLVGGVYPIANESLDDSGWDAATVNRLRVETAFAPPLAIQQPSLEIADLEATARFLAANIDLVVVDHPKMQADGGWHPLVFETPSGTLLNERAFWTLICEASETSTDLILGYVKAVMGADLRHSQMFDRQDGLAGEDALYAWTMKHVNERLSGLHGTDADLGRFADVFTDYMAGWADLDHEVRQDEHFTILLNGLVHNDQNRFVRLLAVRLFNGQSGLGYDPVRERNWLTQRGVFKILVDHVVGRVTGEEILALPKGQFEDQYPNPINSVPKLCWLVYGSDPAAETVLRYVEQRCGQALSIEPTHDSDHRTIKLADTMLASTRSQLDTGFHVFVPDQRRWTAQSEMQSMENADDSGEWWKQFHIPEMADVLLARSDAEVATLLEFLQRELNLGPCDHIFDQCCGSGSLAIPLASAGFQVTGCDLFEPYINRAIADSADHISPPRFVCADAFTFVPDEPCDAVINWYTSFGYAADDAQNSEMLIRAFESLSLIHI